MVAEQMSLSRAKVASKHLAQEPALHGPQGNAHRKVLYFRGDTKGKTEGGNSCTN